MIKLTLKDGSIREIEAASSAAEIVKGIGMGGCLLRKDKRRS